MSKPLPCTSLMLQSFSHNVTCLFLPRGLGFLGAHVSGHHSPLWQLIEPRFCKQSPLLGRAQETCILFPIPARQEHRKEKPKEQKTSLYSFFVFPVLLLCRTCNKSEFLKPIKEPHRLNLQKFTYKVGIRGEIVQQQKFNLLSKWGGEVNNTQKVTPR